MKLQATPSPRGTYSAYDLLAAMRPEVEKILQKHGAELSSCPSQSLRASQLLEKLNHDLNGSKGTLTGTADMLASRRTLEHFLAVHATVRTLEWAERNNGEFQC